MTWTKSCLVFLLLLQGCGIYSFSGPPLPPAAKTFSLTFQANVALGPPDLAGRFTERLGDEVTQHTALKQVETKGNLEFKGAITQFRYESIAPSKGREAEQPSTERLFIALEMDYHNPYEPAASWSKKTFSQYADMPAAGSRDQEEPRLIEEIFTKLVKDIFNQTIASW